jgi:hypothetical protein
LTVESYRLGLQVRIFLPFFYLFASVIAVIGFVSTSGSGDRGGLLFLTVWCVGVATQAWWSLLRMPWRIEADDREIRFVARTRLIAVPWSQLRSLTSPWYDMNRLSIRWEWDGGKLRTMGPWDGQHRLLATIEQRAPGVKISGL